MKTLGSRDCPATGRRHARTEGFSLIELMVGIVIGLLGVLVIFQVFAVAEGLKRNTTAAGDAQTTGLISSFILSQELGNAGSAMMSSAADLQTCDTTGIFNTSTFKTTLRPVPVVIYDSGAPDVSDSVDVYYSVARSVISPTLFTAKAIPPADFAVQAPTQIVAGVTVGGFLVGDAVIALDGTGKCEMSMITGVVPEAGGTSTGTTGNVTLAHTAVTQTYVPGPNSAGLMNLGPANAVQKMHYDVSPPTDPTSPNVLRGQSLLDPATGLPDIANTQPINPIAGNVVLMKLQYGISNLPGPNQFLDTWVAATGPFAPSAILGDGTPGSGMTIDQLTRIKAVRVGIIVRSDQPVSALDANGSDFQKYVTTGFDWVLFDCPAHDATCPGRLTGHIGAYNGQYYRYRVYQQEIPLRNSLWNTN